MPPLGLQSYGVGLVQMTLALWSGNRSHAPQLSVHAGRHPTQNSLVKALWSHSGNTAGYMWPWQRQCSPARCRGALWALLMQIAGFPHPSKGAPSKTLPCHLSISEHICQSWVATGRGRKREERRKHVLLSTETAIFENGRREVSLH